MRLFDITAKIVVGIVIMVNNGLKDFDVLLGKKSGYILDTGT